MKPIRIGVVGLSRGASFAQLAPMAGMELVAICDKWEERLLTTGKQLGVPTYTDYEKFLEHDMDAVALANYFHQHAPFAIRALEAGKHVLSECSACKTLGEGVALARAVEKSGLIYMMAENYAYFNYIQEMRRLYRNGEIGEVRYCEGEYNHPGTPRFINELSPGVDHWRNRLPSTYYCTHALAPIMHVTDTMPLSVNAQSIARTEDEDLTMTAKRGDPGSVILCRMSNGSVARLMGLMLKGHSIWYRFHGTCGLMENMRTGTHEMLRVAHEDWDIREGQSRERIYYPEWTEHADLARQAGHGGGDFYTNWCFAEAIRRNEQPYLDVYRSLAMSVVGIQAWRSCLANGAPQDIPDFRGESTRAAHADDNWSPFAEDQAPGQPPCSILGDDPPTAEGLKYAQEVWKESGLS